MKLSSCSIIYLNRGDSLNIPLIIERDGALNTERYTLTKNDTIYFGIMEPNQKFECALVRKKLTLADYTPNGDLFVKLEPKDTVKLLSGRYYYQIKLETIESADSYRVETLLPKTLFWITE